MPIVRHASMTSAKASAERKGLFTDEVVARQDRSADGSSIAAELSAAERKLLAAPPHELLAFLCREAAPPIGIPGVSELGRDGDCRFLGWSATRWLRRRAWSMVETAVGSTPALRSSAMMRRAPHL